MHCVQPAHRSLPRRYREGGARFPVFDRLRGGSWRQLLPDLSPMGDAGADRTVSPTPAGISRSQASIRSNNTVHERLVRTPPSRAERTPWRVSARGCLVDSARQLSHQGSTLFLILDPADQQYQDVWPGAEDDRRVVVDTSDIARLVSNWCPGR